MKIIKYTGLSLGLLLLSIAAFVLYLNRDLPHEINPATFICLSLDEGLFKNYDTLPNTIYGIGLAYAKHINETASYFEPQSDPPVFIKASESITGNGSKVQIPSKQTMLDAAEQLEFGITQRINQQFQSFPALLDYEVELGFVLLEDIPAENLTREDYAPKVGFFISNDLSARSLAVLGEGQTNRHDYWGISKSFSGFTPISEKIWIPNDFKAHSIPCITIETYVNDEIRQQQSTSDLIYTPLQMLQAIHRKYPDKALQKGDMILTGTPGGVALSTPRWLLRLGGILGLNRFQKLKRITSEKSISKFLKNGDKVMVKGEGLGSVEVEIIN